MRLRIFIVVLLLLGYAVPAWSVEEAGQVLFDRLENFQLTVPVEELAYMPNILLRGLEELPIRYTSAA